MREAARARVERAAVGGQVLVLPSASGVAPPLDLDGAPKADLRRRTLTLTCLAGLAGTPAVSVPIASSEDLPVGVCLLGGRGTDEHLLDLVASHR